MNMDLHAKKQLPHWLQNVSPLVTPAFHSARASVPMAAPIRAQSALSKEAADEIALGMFTGQPRVLAFATSAQPDCTPCRASLYIRQ